MIRLVVACALGLTMPLASAAILGFDDLDPLDGSVAQQQYGGFEWDSRWALGSTNMSAFQDVAVSGDQFLYNAGLTSNLTIKRADPFDFLGVWLTAPTSRDKAYWVDIKAYDAGNNLIGNTSYQRIYESPLWLSTTFTNVSRLVVDPHGGIFTLDGFSYRDTLVSLTEAGSLALLGIGLFGLWAVRRRAQV